MKNKTKLLRLTACLLTVALVLTAIITVWTLIAKVSDEAISSFINKYEGDLKSLGYNVSDYYDGKVIQPLPDSVKDDEDISLVIQVSETPLLDAYTKDAQNRSFADYL